MKSFIFKICNLFSFFKASCSNKPCLNGGTCVMGLNNSTTCFCPNGFSGVNCELPTTCNTLFCQNGGTCVTDSSTNTPRCKCNANFYGKRCEVGINAQLCISNDTNSTKCLTWSALGYCDFTYIFNDLPVPVYCPSTCGLCKKVLTCVDQQLNCDVWSKLGMCSTINAVDANICKKSCGNCAGVSRSFKYTINETFVTTKVINTKLKFKRII